MLNAILNCCIRSFYLGVMAEETNGWSARTDCLAWAVAWAGHKSTPTLPDDPVAGTRGVSVKEPKEEEFGSELMALGTSIDGLTQQVIIQSFCMRWWQGNHPAPRYWCLKPLEVGELVGHLEMLKDMPGDLGWRNRTYHRRPISSKRWKPVVTIWSTSGTKRMISRRLAQTCNGRSRNCVESESKIPGGWQSLCKI